MKKNKLIYGVLFCLAVSLTNAQIAVGKANVNGVSTILDFANEAGNTKGIVVPAVDNLPSGPTGSDNGMFLFDRSDRKFKVFENNIWKDLSDPGNASSLAVNPTAETGQKVIIGSASTSANGVVVLESADKAMILPFISNPHQIVKSPYPGMMCYDPVSKALAVFDGNVWSYWK
ncbi:hypothetical protein HNP38_000535 [Chryseobacterium defluvii]|uniref:Uncharacterized protein n=1 Tax=Chryseobacterium defluvii TaxID=160396 RepID=A0A840KCK5_9FLAO|nr:UTP--glucose-1-phosphate uridylyltransferase [Chryseobacterium defluvii]MBB4805263.1 hypothetical protein [Chryseobacterium defluvii]